MQKSQPTLLFVLVTLFANLYCQDLLSIDVQLPPYEEIQQKIDQEQPVSGVLLSKFVNLDILIPEKSDDNTKILGFQRNLKKIKKKNIDLDKFASMKFKFVFIMYTAEVDQENNTETIHSCDTEYDDQDIIDIQTAPAEEEWHSYTCEPNLYQICSFCWKNYQYKLGDCAQCYTVVDEDMGTEMKDIKPDNDGCGIEDFANFVNNDVGVGTTNSLSAGGDYVTLLRSTNTMYYSIPIIGIPEANELLLFRKPNGSQQLIDLLYQIPDIPLSLVPSQKEKNRNVLNLLI